MDIILLFSEYKQNLQYFRILLDLEYKNLTNIQISPTNISKLLCIEFNIDRSIKLIRACTNIDTKIKLCLDIIYYQLQIAIYIFSITKNNQIEILLTDIKNKTIFLKNNYISYFTLDIFDIT
jgi:hypothetical protein